LGLLCWLLLASAEAEAALLAGVVLAGGAAAPPTLALAAPSEAAACALAVARVLGGSTCLLGFAEAGRRFAAGALGGDSKDEALDCRESDSSSSGGPAAPKLSPLPKL